jgi:hypothetical protein
MMDEQTVMDKTRAMGMEEDRMLSNVFQTGAPTGRFSETALNSLVGAFNEVLVSMGIPEPYPEFQGGAKSLPGEFVKGLAMVADAAQSVGVPNPVDLADVKDDTDLEMLAGKLLSLAENEEFVSAITAPVGGEMGMEPDVEGGPAAPAVDDTEDLFMQRM